MGIEGQMECSAKISKLLLHTRVEIEEKFQ